MRKSVAGTAKTWRTATAADTEALGATLAASLPEPRNALIVGGIALGAALLLILLGAVYVNRAVARPVRSAAEAAALFDRG